MSFSEDVKRMLYIHGKLFELQQNVHRTCAYQSIFKSNDHFVSNLFVNKNKNQNNITRFHLYVYFSEEF